MICALVVDLNHDREFPVDRPVLGRALAVYPLMAAKASHYIDRTYLVADAPAVKAVALQYDTIIVDPPETADAAAAIEKGVLAINADLERESRTLELAAIMFTHVPTVTSELIDIGVDTLREFDDADAAVSVSKHNHCNPYAALRESKDNRFEPYLPYQPGPHPDAWYPDLGLSLVRPAALGVMRQTRRPYPWMGERVVGLKQWGGGALDAAWQAPHVESWLKKHGIADISPTMELQPKPQPAPKGDRR